jgi:hypothetical protein
MGRRFKDLVAQNISLIEWDKVRVYATSPPCDYAWAPETTNGLPQHKCIGRMGGTPLTVADRGGEFFGRYGETTEQWICFDLGMVCKFTEMKVFFRSKSRDVWARRLRLEKARDGPDGPWIVVKNASEDAADPEHFVVDKDGLNWQHFVDFEAYTQYVRLVLVDNHGSPDYVMISQVRFQ